MPTLDALESRLGHAFADRRLLQRALTHRSASADHNERLEFLGDAVLTTVVSSLLYARFGDSDEGDLTRVRAHLVREESLHRLALELQLPDWIRVSEGELRNGGTQRASMLADAVEAIVAAAFLDGGYAAANAVVQKLYGASIDAADMHAWGKDAKTELQEWLQARKLPTPSYRIVATRGQAHAQTFEVECGVASLHAIQRGEGKSRRMAEQVAARRLLAQLAEARIATTSNTAATAANTQPSGH